MKIKLPLILIFVLLIPLILKSQGIDTIKKFNYNDDFILKKIINALPSGWIFSVRDSEFIIEYKDSVIIADRKSLNINNNQALSMDSILKYGHKGKSQIIYKYEQRWTDEQTLLVKSNNTEISRQITKLPDKYGIAYLLDKSKSSRRTNVYTGHTAQEIQFVKQFEIEKNELMAKIVKIPMYKTEKYSLFLKSMLGCNDNNNYVYPSEISLQLFEILTLFNELTEKSE